MGWLRNVAGGCSGIAVALMLGACGGSSAGDDDATPPIIRTAVAQANDIVLEADDVGEGWEALPDDTGTPEETPGVDAILNRAFKSWASCVGNLVAGGFVGIGRAGTASSPRFSDGSGRLVANASAIFTEKSRADQVVGDLAESGEYCGGLGENFRVELSELPDVPPDAVASYRMTATLQARNGNFSDTFDLIVLQKDLAVLSLVFKSFGANEAGQTDIVAAAAAKLNGT
jgi:hypothetical protein